MSADASEPADALSRLVHAVGAGRDAFDPEDLHALSGLAADRSAPLRAGLNQLDADGRVALLDQLHQTMQDGGGYEFTALFAVALSDSDASVRSLATAGLGVCETADATAALLTVAQSDEEEDEVRAEAAAALGEVALRRELGWASSEGADPVVPALRAIAEDVREEEHVRAAALAGVAVVAADWVAPLIDDAFESGDPLLRIGAVQAMGRSADEAWLGLLEAALESDDEDERLAAAAATGAIASEDGVPLLTDVLEDPSADLELVCAAIRALGAIGGEEAVEQLEQLRTHPEAAARHAAQEALEEASWLDQRLDDDPFAESWANGGGC